MKTVCYNCHRVLNGSPDDPDTDHRGICDRCRPLPVRQNRLEVAIVTWCAIGGVVAVGLCFDKIGAVAASCLYWLLTKVSP